MKVTFEFDTNESRDEATLVRVLQVLQGADPTTAARDAARDLHAGKTENKGDETPPAYDPEARIYGEKGEKSRRTKEEMAEDDDIKARWEALWPSKDVPAQPVGVLKAHLDKVEANTEPETNDDEGGFEVDGEPDTETDEDVLDLDEFRGILQKGMKRLGGATMGEIMKPYKNATEVPEEERRDYAAAIEKAIAAKK